MQFAIFGEPVFGFAKVTGKGTARWRRMVFLGKTDPQDTYILFDGHELVLTRSIRRISTVWRGHLPFYMNFRCWSVEYKTAFGGRIVPTRAQSGALTASFSAPAGKVEPSAFFDEDAEAVRQKHLEEVREDIELTEMMVHDKAQQPEATTAPEAGEPVDDGPKRVQFTNPIGIFDDDVAEGEQQPKTPVEMAPQAMVSSGPSSAAMSSQVDVPQTPEAFQAVPATPRTSPTTRQHDIEPDDHESKRAMVEASKKQRFDRISADYASMVRSVKFSNDELFTMDEYDNDLSMDDHVNVNPWLEEESDDTPMDCIPNDFWSDQPPDHPPPEPEAWIDLVADHVELSRLCNMNVLVEGNDMQLGATNTLTTKFVYDWRLKDRVRPDGSTVKAWLRRSRLVARKFAFWEKRSDTYAPATSTHILNVLPMLYLQSLVDVPEHDKSETKVCLGTVDVKDTFLMVDQPSPMLVTLLGKAYTVKRNLPGQRLGAKSWYWHLRGFLCQSI